MINLKDSKSPGENRMSSKLLKWMINFPLATYPRLLVTTGVVAFLISNLDLWWNGRQNQLSECYREIKCLRLESKDKPGHYILIDSIRIPSGMICWTDHTWIAHTNSKSPRPEERVSADLCWLAASLRLTAHCFYCKSDDWTRFTESDPDDQVTIGLWIWAVLSWN